jgi:4-hydroxybenzoate polyprenyltransferase
MADVPGLVRLVHPAPAAAVVGLSFALGAILSHGAGLPPFGWRVILTTLSVLGSQIATGAMNDWADRDRDAAVQPMKPIPSGEVTPGAALGLAGAGLALQVGTALPLGPLALGLGLVAVGSAIVYDLWLSRTAASFVPYLVSFGVLPLWVAAGVGVPLETVAIAPLLVGPFAVAAHLANTLKDYEGDAAIGSGNLAQRLGKRTATIVAWTLAMGVGLGAGIGLAIAGGMEPASAVLGIAGLLAVAQGVAGPNRLWSGILLAAVAWTAAWALVIA